MSEKDGDNSVMFVNNDKASKEPQECLADFVRLNNIQLKKINFQNPVNNSSLSAKEMGVDLSKIIKTVVFKDENGSVYAAIVRGQQDVDTKIIKKFYKIKDLRLIARDDVIKEIGYPAGGVPPFGFAAKFILDSSLDSDEVVYAGGGSVYSLIEIKISEIERVAQSNKIKISK